MPDPDRLARPTEESVGPGQRNHDLSDGCVPSHPGPAELQDIKWAAFIHAEGHDDAGSDFELCDDPDCPHWPDSRDPNEEQPFDA